MGGDSGKVGGDGFQGPWRKLDATKRNTVLESVSREQQDRKGLTEKVLGKL